MQIAICQLRIVLVTPHTRPNRTPQADNRPQSSPTPATAPNTHSKKASRFAPIQNSKLVIQN
ncbi:hypothetical protein A6770_26465 [Nostoc minutum NIES-26]|uniref:Uncharacterized protein n=1 Tax=Nostoc minutum NIES-26 TaxID=1844469 RepID=A0A367QSD4_9NOSO|nr:hypothetical protein A6770_26465 [Nostoc minutum NIES-26]